MPSWLAFAAGVMFGGAFALVRIRGAVRAGFRAGRIETLSQCLVSLKIEEYRTKTTSGQRVLGTLRREAETELIRMTREEGR